MTTIDLVGHHQQTSLAEQLSGGTPYVLMFAGQGGEHRDRLAQLRGTYGADIDADRLWTDALDRLGPVLADLSPWWPADPRSADWSPRARRAPMTTGDAEEVVTTDGDRNRWGDPAASVPDITYTQLLEIRALRVNRLDTALTLPSAVVGHSQGSIAALAASGVVDDATALALAHLIGVAIARVARHHGLVRTGQVSPMLGVADVERSTLDELLVAFHHGASGHGLPDVEDRVVVGVTNAPRRHVLVGRPERLANFATFVDRRVADGDDPIGTPEMPAPRWDEVAVASGFHHPALEPAVDMVVAWAERCGLRLDGAPTCRLANAADPAALDIDEIARWIATDHLDWPSTLDRAISDAPSWFVDVGPGVVAGRLTRSLLRGRGIGVAASAPVGGVSELITPGAAPAVETSFEQYRPGLLELDDGRVAVDTKLTRLTGHSPFILAGMTPTTVDAAIVAAAANAGVWAELAGGGQVTAAILRERMVELRELLDDGVGVHFNTLHLDPYLWGLHLGQHGALLDELRRGAPVRGVTVSAGIPELDEATALIETLAELGVETVTFKPGTIDGIRTVIEIAEAVAPHPVIAHIEGGRAGGHHSWEDLDDLLLATYADLRCHENVVICVGGGIGTAATAATYLDGTWAEAHGLPPMPVDGILIGTAAMGCAEATTSPQVKQLLVECSGTTEWIDAGASLAGVASGRSQLGADIHELDNAASRTGRLLDEVAGDADQVAARRDEIIAALAATAKPYFGDVAEMTYLGLLERFAQLCAIGRNGRYEDGTWLDQSWRARFIDLAQRAEARLDPLEVGRVATRFADPTSVDDPATAIADILTDLPDLATTLLHPADVSHFVAVCRRAGKPVPFVPVLDEEVRRWWRSDSLWQAHDDRFDADAVVVIPGPAAISGIHRVDEPVAELFARLEAEVVESLSRAGDIGRRASSRRRVFCDIQGSVGIVLSEPAVCWAGSRRRNPALEMAPAREWAIDEQGVGHANDDRARLIPGDDHVTLEVTISLAGHDPEVAQLRLDLAGGPAAGIVITSRSAQEWSDQLLAIANGGDDSTDTTASTDTVLVDAARDKDHAAVFGAATPLPDALVGLVWPAVFRALATGTDGSPLAGRFMDLVHLDHTLALHSDLPGTGRLQVAVALDAISDTGAGRVLAVTVELQDQGRAVATLRERFLVRGVTGGDQLHAADPTCVNGSAVPTERRTLCTTTVTAPPNAAQMATFTGDENPLHSSTEVARIAGFASPIVHGMWVSAAMQHAARTSGDAPSDLLDWQVQFLAPLHHGEQVTISVVRTGQVDGGSVVEVTARGGEELVATAVGRLRAPRTAYAFPGQGIQRVGMGLDALGRSGAARTVWERADRHTRSRLGFSILHVVRDNPVEITAGEHTFRHPDGVLFLTQFTQVAMATLASAQVAELREAGGFVPDAICCGHSVGEYNALAAVTGILELEAVLELVYHRGLAMHRLVPRDADGASPYRMAAARPSEAGMNESQLVDLVDQIAADFAAAPSTAAGAAESIQVVNFNLRGRQYAIAGTIAALGRLEDELEERRRRRGGKGVFVYVPGIDVPFHSAVLRDGVSEFRSRLDAILPAQIDPAHLVGRYVPNLVPRLFTLDQDFVAEIAATVPSTLLRDVLDDWETWQARPAALCRVMLLELLAWQFASPVRWIETQDLLFGDSATDNTAARPSSVSHSSVQHSAVQRFIEIGLGSQPTISSLARQTLAMSDGSVTAPTVLNIDLDRASLFGEDVDEFVEELDDAAGSTPTNDAGTTDPHDPTPTVPTPSTPAAPTAAEAVADLSWSPADGLRLMLSWWTKIRPDQLGASDSIEGLCDGASSRRNQLLMDLGAEFGLGAIEGAAEADLAKLTDEVTTRARTYRNPGPVLRTTIDEQLRRITGPAKARPTTIADRVQGHWGLGAGWASRVTAAIASATRSGASGRGGDLAWLTPVAPASPAELDTLIDAAVTELASQIGVAVAPPSTDSGGTLDAAAAAALLDTITGDDGVLTDIARVLDHHLGAAPDADGDDSRVTDALTVAELVERELGSTWISRVQPSFDPAATVVIDDRWAGQREDLLQLATSDPNDTCLRDELQARLVGLSPVARQQASWWRDRAGGDDADLATRLETVLGAHEPATPFAQDIALVTGASPGSIAASVVARLLAGGATVIATSSRLDHQRVQFFRDLYHAHGVPGAALWLAPANLAATTDVDALVEWVVHPQTTSAGGATRALKPAFTPTLLFPFAAPSVAGELGDVGPRAELEMRVLLWSVERLIAGLADARGTTGSAGRLHVVLPGSPNRGMFGGDGAYGEAKAALDALARRSSSETWGETVGIVHAVIGWVRGTGLMGGNDGLVAAVEDAGVTTWAPADMADALLSLCDDATRTAAGERAVDADLSGGLLGAALDLRAIAAQANDAADESSETALADGAPPDAESRGTAGRGATDDDGATIDALPSPPRLDHSGEVFEWPATTAALDDTVVIVGLGEVGPLGSTRTRFDVEVTGRLSPAGVAELAWLCGLIRWETQPTPGFYDTTSNELVPEHEMVERYHDVLLEHSGIRVLEDDGAMVDGAVPLLASVYLERDLTFTVDDEAAAQAFVDADAERTHAEPAGDGSWTVTRRAGTEIRVPRQLDLPRQVGAQLPAGFDPTTYGIPADMAASIDRVAIWNLVATVDAFVGAGIEPSELLRWIHPADIANTQGTGIGGITAIRSMYVDSLLGEPHANDVLQEALPNVVAAHVMQSYIGGYGSMVHPVAACATAAVSVEEGFDKIRSGRASIVVAGGFDDYGPEGLVGFAAMNATAPSDDLTRAGIDANHMSRPNDRRRAGFVEGQGGGTIVLARGDVAAELGLPVRAVVAWAGSFSDGVNTSIPAPGLGLVAAARGGAASVLARRLAGLGVGADDIDVVSKHDTSTLANDPNESLVHEHLADALGRDERNPLVVVSQKNVTGHAKGGAAAFQIAGLCQVLEHGVVPANRSLDCVDPALEAHTRLVWPTRTVRPSKRLRAGLVSSLGFGHVAAIVAVVHRDAFLALLDPADRGDYLRRSGIRALTGARRRLAAQVGGPPLYRRPDRRLGDDHDDERRLELAMLVDPDARLAVDGVIRTRADASVVNPAATSAAGTS